MEVLDQLEQRLTELLARLESLAAENASLRQEQERDLASLADENQRLQEDLEKMRTRDSATAARIESLVARIREQAEL